MTTTAHRTDHTLTTAVTDELAFSPDVVADEIGVALSSGAVVLTGRVSSYLEKAAAVRAALRVRGVTALADEIEVENRWGSRTDADIARDAAAALAGRVVPEPGAVTAVVRDHEVTLTGSVAWNFQREAAVEAVAGLVGVTAVHDEVRLEPQLPFAADDAGARIDAALVRRAHLDAEQVRVAVDGSRITLTGTVLSWSEHREAGWAAWATPGVTQVQNHLRVLR